MGTRKRKQVVISYRDKPTGKSIVGYAEIRIVTYNPEITLRMLKMVAMQERRNLEVRLKTRLSTMDMFIDEGTEIRETDELTDITLDNKNIYKQIRIRNEVIEYDIVK